MKERFIEKDFTDDDYLKFLNFCSSNFEFFYLYRRSDLKPLSPKGETGLKSLEKFLVSKSIGDQFLSGERMMSENIFLEIYKFACNDKSIQQLHLLRKSLFSWQLPNSLEDLSFENAKNNSIFISISHENYANFKAPEKIIKLFDEKFPDHSVTDSKLLSQDEKLNKDWILDINGNYIYIGEDE